MSQKRKSDGQHHSVLKTRRLEKGHSISQKANGNGTYTEVPPLPSIDKQYEEPVFTHPSLASQEGLHSKMVSYDRLEFLGDAYLEIIASRLIFDSYQHLPAGRMSQMRELLIKNDTLSQFTTLYGFDKRLKTAPSKERDTAQGWLKAKGDVFEAYVAAVILSDPVSGYKTAQEWLTKLWEPKIKDFNTGPIDVKSKEELARKIMAKGVKISYVDERPPVIHRGKGIETYYVGVYVTGWGWENQHLGSGKGLSKVAAGMEAAAQALENHPLIDEMVAKKTEFLAQRQEEEEK